MPANPPPAQLLPVEQADRDRAADYLEGTARTTSSPNDRTMMHLAELIRLGTAHHPLIDAFAAHRLTHSPERGELASLVEALRQIASGAANGEQLFRDAMHGKRSLTWAAVNILQDYLAASGGTAAAALHALSASQGGEK